MDRCQLADKLEGLAGGLSRYRVVTGFDGFVDEMLSVVETRQDLQRYTPVPTISRFGELVGAAAGHSSLREVVVTATEAGGCAVNLGDGLAALGVAVDTFATLGEPIHAAFAGYARVARLHSWGPAPGRTLALEFGDGKLMFSEVAHLGGFTPEHVQQRLEEGVYAAACERATLIALTDWTLFPHMTAIWRLLSRQVFAGLAERPRLLVDLVDPSGRSDEDLAAMIEALTELAVTTRLTLGLNQNEANVLARLLGLGRVSPADRERSSDQAVALRSRLGVEEVVLHTPRFAVLAAVGGEAVLADGPYTPAPLKSTGAGDRFNAGYGVGLMLGMSAEERLLLAAAVSGAFVRLARSAAVGEVAGLLRAAEPWPASTAVRRHESSSDRPCG